MAAERRQRGALSDSEVANDFAADVRLSDASNIWTLTPFASGCANMYDLESVMTHERGHSFGLGHVGEIVHGELTMSTNMNGACGSAKRIDERSLGRGDILGLRVLY